MPRSRDNQPDSDQPVPPESRRLSARTLLRALGPGLITGASDDDPSGIGTYAAAGASAGLGLLWLSLYSLPLMSAVQLMCARIGVVKGRGLAGLIRQYYPKWVLVSAVSALIIANTINAGADLGAIAAGFSLLVPLKPLYLVVPIAAILVSLQLWVSYVRMEQVLKYLTLALLAYVGSAILTHPNWSEVLRATLVPAPRFDPQFLSLVVAVLGTTISPYMFFWQASQEVEEEIAMGRTRLSQRQGATDTELALVAYDVNVGMIFSNVVMFFIILATANTLHRTGHTHIGSAVEAARALEPLAGRWSEALLAIGLIGSGALAVPVLTGSAAYALAEARRWKAGLELPPRKAKHFYTVIVASTAVAVVINFLRINPFDALVWTAIVNGVIAPPLLFIIVRLTGSKKVMGDRANGLPLQILGWITFAVMTAAAIAMFATLGRG